MRWDKLKIGLKAKKIESIVQSPTSATQRITFTQTDGV
jgi:hypothetical protein